MGYTHVIIYDNIYVNQMSMCIYYWDGLKKPPRSGELQSQVEVQNVLAISGSRLGFKKRYSSSIQIVQDPEFPIDVWDEDFDGLSTDQLIMIDLSIYLSNLSNLT